MIQSQHWQDYFVSDPLNVVFVVVVVIVVFVVVVIVVFVVFVVVQPSGCC